MDRICYRVLQTYHRIFRRAPTKTRRAPRETSQKEQYSTLDLFDLYRFAKARGISLEELLVHALVKQDSYHDERPDTKLDMPRPTRSQYSSISLSELFKIAKVRGISPEDLLVNALVEQDRYHAEHPFPFLVLPAELRNQIYSYLLVSTQRVELYNDLKIPLLARVSSQVRRESLEVFFGYNTLHVSTCRHYRKKLGTQEPYLGLSQDTVRLLDRIAPHKDHLRKVLISGFVWLKGSRAPTSCGMTLALERCINRTPQYVAGVELWSGFRKDVHHASPVKPLRSEGMKLLKESIEKSVKDCAQAYLDQHTGSFTFSARDINALFTALTACVKVDIDKFMTSVTPSELE